METKSYNSLGETLFSQMYVLDMKEQSVRKSYSQCFKILLKIKHLWIEYAPLYEKDTE